MLAGYFRVSSVHAIQRGQPDPRKNTTNVFILLNYQERKTG
jgi:hypothetical protein